MGVASSQGWCCTERMPNRKLSRPLSTCYVDFRKPAEATQQGGAQARLFHLIPVVGGSGSSRRPGGAGPEWLGKDVASSFNEVDFYNEVLFMRRQQQQDPPLQPVLPKLSQAEKEDDLGVSHNDPWGVVDFMVSYHGLARSCTCTWVSDGRERQRSADLLVFRSPFEGLARPRMLHLELGPKSLALQARRGGESAAGVLARQEGVFVDGFLSPPACIPSEGPTLDLRGWSWGDSIQRRAKRLPLQRLSLAQALNAMIDLRAPIAEERWWPSDNGHASTSSSAGRGGAENFLRNFLSAAEYAELALLTFVRELARLVRCCEEVPVPQKWVQSAMALLLEAGVAPPRTGPISPESWIANRVKVQILGWSKSRLSVPGCITEDEHQDNELPWKIYQHHVGRVLWESTRLYFHRFCSEEWTQLHLQLYEVSHKGTTLLIGSAEAPLQMEAASTGPLLLRLHKGDKALASNGEPTTVEVTAKFQRLPEPSNFEGQWQIHFVAMHNLDVGSATTSTSSMYVDVCVSDSSGMRTASQRTHEVLQTSDVCWNEEFEFPVVGSAAANSAKLLEALGQPGHQLHSFEVLAATRAGGSLSRHLPPLSMQSPEVDKKDDLLAASSAQLAFLTELSAGWHGDRCGFLAC